jgi:hypothetical protein
VVLLIYRLMSKIGKLRRAAGSTPDHAHETVSESRCAQELEEHPFLFSKSDDLHERSQAQRWRAIYKAAFDQASGAEHADEVTKDFSYSRGEAEAMIAQFPLPACSELADEMQRVTGTRRLR